MTPSGRTDGWIGLDAVARLGRFLGTLFVGGGVSGAHAGFDVGYRFTLEVRRGVLSRKRTSRF